MIMFGVWCVCAVCAEHMWHCLLFPLFILEYHTLQRYKMDEDLAAKFNRREQINEGNVPTPKVTQSVYAEFKEFSIQEIKEFKKIFVK